MNKFEWNGLQVGDRVVAYEHRSGVHAGGRHGAVAFVTKHRRHNAVGIRLDDEPPEVRWLTRFEVERLTTGVGSV